MWDRQVTDACGLLPTGRSACGRSLAVIRGAAHTVHPSDVRMVDIAAPDCRPPATLAAFPALRMGLMHPLVRGSVVTKTIGKVCRSGPTPQLRDWRCGGVLGSSGPFKLRASTRSGEWFGHRGGFQANTSFTIRLSSRHPVVFRGNAGLSQYVAARFAAPLEQNNHDHRCYRRPGVCRIAAGS